MAWEYVRKATGRMGMGKSASGVKCKKKNERWGSRQHYVDVSALKSTKLLFALPFVTDYFCW